jgi:hypothetical protein
MAKQRKVGEPAGTYITKKPAITTSLAPKAGEQHVRYIDAKTARKLTEQIFDKHHELFRKLAQ